MAELAVKLKISYNNKSVTFWSSVCFIVNIIFLFLGESDLDKVFQLPNTTFIGDGTDVLTLREIINRLEVCEGPPDHIIMIFDLINTVKLKLGKRHLEFYLWESSLWLSVYFLNLLKQHPAEFFADKWPIKVMPLQLLHSCKSSFLIDIFGNKCFLSY